MFDIETFISNMRLLRLSVVRHNASFLLEIGCLRFISRLDISLNKLGSRMSVPDQTFIETLVNNMMLLLLLWENSFSN